MQDPLDSFTVEVEWARGCTCAAHGLLIRHAADCEAFESELTREQVETVVAAFLALYDAMIAQGKRRHPLTAAKRSVIRRAFPYAEALLGTEHRSAR